MQTKNLESGLINTQILIILLPVVLIIRLLKMNQVEVLRLHPPKVSNLLLVPFIAIPAALLVTMVGQLINLIYPFPAEYLAKLSGLMKMPHVPLWEMYLIIALLPGFCEELMFRGFVIRFFEGQGKWVAILTSAGLFALFHLDPYRFIPVLLLGILLGWLVTKANSIWVSMFSHMINNAAALTFSTYAGSKIFKPLLMGNEDLNWWVAIPAVVVFLAALSVFNRNNREQTEDIN